MAGLYFLVQHNSEKSQYATLSILVYGLTLISMFSVSSANHFAINPVLKKRFRIMDHINIYLLIAGTYTPVALITLINGNGWTLFYAVCIIVGLESLFKLCYTGKLEFLSLSLYAAMGWLIVLDFHGLMDDISPLGLRLLFLGGVFYTFDFLFCFE